jgi:hypothetical protein
MSPFLLCPIGEIGRHRRLKISRLWRVGSIPAWGTTHSGPLNDLTGMLNMKFLKAFVHWFCTPTWVDTDEDEVFLTDEEKTMLGIN